MRYFRINRYLLSALIVAVGGFCSGAGYRHPVIRAPFCRPFTPVRTMRPWMARPYVPPGGLRSFPDEPGVSVRPGSVDTVRVVRALDRIFRAYCSESVGTFLHYVSDEYELGRRRLYLSLRRSRTLYDQVSLDYRISNIRAFQSTVDVCLRWTKEYRVKKTRTRVVEHGTTNIALDARDRLRLLSQKGTILFGSAVD